MKNTLVVFCATFLSIGLLASPASAAGSTSGWKECGANQRIAISSSTALGGVSSSIFSVGHQVLGGNNFNWTTAGFHKAKHNKIQGNWAISTNGTLNSGGASCE
ncbi:hypothetical protein [Timonella senegalensis]|uniref:hypothetical protein n=1 Tax=Timonella senegalensis TaxID=1465825 RepID=UPI0028AE7E07|nr:hypothetical protein [Timonella senegalensis]